jgi:hypothetical protein
MVAPAIVPDFHPQQLQFAIALESRTGSSED